jgi:hypothetical protein
VRLWSSQHAVDMSTTAALHPVPEHESCAEQESWRKTSDCWTPGRTSGRGQVVIAGSGIGWWAAPNPVLSGWTRFEPLPWRAPLRLAFVTLLQFDRAVAVW